MRVNKTLEKEVMQQIGDAQYTDFVEYLGHKYEVSRKMRTPTTSTLELISKAKTHEELVRIMMSEYLSNK